MTQTAKKLVTIIVAFTVSLILIITANAETPTIVSAGKCGDNVTYTLDTNGLMTISGTGEMWNLNEYAEQPWYDIRGDVKELKILHGVTSIGERTFHNAFALIKVTIPSTVTKIGYRAFSDCTSLVIIYNNSDLNVNDVSNYLCAVVNKDGSITYKKGYTNDGNGFIFNSSNNLCAYIGSEETVILPDTYMSEPYTVSSVRGARKIIVPNNVTEILSYAFADCGSLEEVTLPDSFTSIARYTFRNCKNLTTVTIGSGITEIGEDAFALSENLKKVYISDLAAWCNISFTSSASNPLYYGAELYLNGTLVTELTIPNKVTKIGDYAFYGCTSITDVTFSKNMTEIAPSSFQNCTSLESITIHEAMAKVNYKAFKGCTALETAKVLSKTTIFGTHAFDGCSQLTIFSHRGSRAETYAKNNDHKFEVINICDEHIYTQRTEEPTCTNKGKIITACSICGVSEEEAIPAKGHSFTIEDITWATCTQKGFTTHICSVCGDSYSDSEVEPTGHTFGLWITDIEPTTETLGSKYRKCHCGETERESIPQLKGTSLLLSDATAMPGDTVKITLSLNTDVRINTIAISNLRYDTATLEFLGFSDYEAIQEMPLLTAMFDDERGFIVIGFTEDVVYNGDICTLEFKVKENAKDTVAVVTADFLVKLDSNVIDTDFRHSGITVYTRYKGDIDGDFDVDIDDAIYLLGYSILPQYFPMDYPMDIDFNGDGNVDIADAILIFNYSMLPDIFPIN